MHLILFFCNITGPVCRLEYLSNLVRRLDKHVLSKWPHPWSLNHIFVKWYYAWHVRLLACASYFVCNHTDLVCRLDYLTNLVWRLDLHVLRKHITLSLIFPWTFSINLEFFTFGKMNINISYFARGCAHDFMHSVFLLVNHIDFTSCQKFVIFNSVWVTRG